MKEVKRAVGRAVHVGGLESLQSILIGIVEKPMPCAESLSALLRQTQDATGFAQYVELDDTKDGTLAKHPTTNENGSMENVTRTQARALLVRIKKKGYARAIAPRRKLSPIGR